MIGRRGLLQGLALFPAVGIATQAKAEPQILVSPDFAKDLKALVASVPQIYHPWLPIQPLTAVPGMIHALRTRWAPPVPPGEEMSPFDIARFYAGPVDPKKRRISIQVNSHVVSADHPRFEATRHGLRALEESVLADVFAEEPQRADMGLSAHRVIAVSNMAAARNRRGRLGILLVHEDDLAALISLPMSNGKPMSWVRMPGYGMTCGNWRQAGIYGDQFEVWTHRGVGDVWKRGHVVSVYRATVLDFPLIVAAHETGYYIHRNSEDEPGYLPTRLTDYMQAIPITEATV